MGRAKSIADADFDEVLVLERPGGLGGTALEATLRDPTPPSHPMQKANETNGVLRRVAVHL